MESKVGSRCEHCNTPLTLYCQKCRASPTKATDVTNSTSPPLRIKKEKKDAVDEDLLIHFEDVKNDRSEIAKSSRNSNAHRPSIKDSSKNQDVVVKLDDDDEDDDGGGGFEDGNSDDNDVNYSEDDDDDDEDYEKPKGKRGGSATRGRKRTVNGKQKYSKFLYVCPFCNAESDMSEHTEHMKQHEDLITTKTDKNEYKCTLCTRKFKVSVSMPLMLLYNNNGSVKPVI